MLRLGSRHAADPKALGGRFAQVDARGTTADRYSHSLVILALVDAHTRSRPELEALHELEKLRIFFEDAENFVRAGDLSVRQAYSAEFAPEFGHAAEQRNAVRAANVAAKSLQ